VDEIVQGRCGVDRVVEVEDQEDEEGERGLAARGRVVEEVVDWPDWEYEPQQHRVRRERRAEEPRDSPVTGSAARQQSAAFFANKQLATAEPRPHVPITNQWQSVPTSTNQCQSAVRAARACCQSPTSGNRYQPITNQCQSAPISSGWTARALVSNQQSPVPIITNHYQPVPISNVSHLLPIINQCQSVPIGADRAGRAHFLSCVRSIGRSYCIASARAKAIGAAHRKAVSEHAQGSVKRERAQTTRAAYRTRRIAARVCAELREEACESSPAILGKPYEEGHMRKAI
jgi:hypothetical protein